MAFTHKKFSTIFHCFSEISVFEMNKFLHLDDNNSQFYVIDSFRSMKCEIDTGVYLLDFFAPALCTVEFALSPFYILIYMFWR